MFWPFVMTQNLGQNKNKYNENCVRLKATKDEMAVWKQEQIYTEFARSMGSFKYFLNNQGIY